MYVHGLVLWFLAVGVLFLAVEANNVALIVLSSVALWAAALLALASATWLRRK